MYNFFNRAHLCCKNHPLRVKQLSKSRSNDLRLNRSSDDLLPGIHLDISEVLSTVLRTFKIIFCLSCKWNLDTFTSIHGGFEYTEQTTTGNLSILKSETLIRERVHDRADHVTFNEPFSVYRYYVSPPPIYRSAKINIHVCAAQFTQNSFFDSRFTLNYNFFSSQGQAITNN